jgi:hypothetical protein
MAFLTFSISWTSSSNGTAVVLPPYDTIYYFDQLIDHHNPALGTFQQR